MAGREISPFPPSPSLVCRSEGKTLHCVCEACHMLVAMVSDAPQHHRHKCRHLAREQILQPNVSQKSHSHIHRLTHLLPLPEEEEEEGRI